MKRLRGVLNNIHPTMLKLSLLEFTFWATLAAYYPFVVLFLQSKGLSNTSIGMILSINSFIVVFAQPLWGMISDRIQSVKKILLLCLVATTIILQFLPFLNTAILLALFMTVLTIFESPLSPLLDSWVIQGIRDEQDLSYGNIRLWGSLGYSIFAYVFGIVVDTMSIRYNFLFFVCMVIPVILLINQAEDKGSASSVSLKDIKIGKLLKNYSYITFLVFSMILYIPHRAAFSFLPNLLMDVGSSAGSQGLASAIMAFSEVPVFLMTRKLLKRYKPVHLILLSALFFLLRQVAYLAATSPTQVLLAQLFHGPSFALFLNGAVYYIDSLAPDELKSTAQTLATSLYTGVSGIIANFGGGWVIDNLGIRWLYKLGIYVLISITLLFIISLALGKNISDDYHPESKPH